MSAPTKIENCVNKCNFLDKPAKACEDFFKNHPTLLKIALFVNHLFRAGAMVGFMLLLPVPMPACLAICFAGSLFYRLTVEPNCSYKFALPAFAGAVAFLLACPEILNMIHGTAFNTAKAGVIAFASIVPLLGYAGYVALNVNYEVNKKLSEQKCCENPRDTSDSIVV